MERFLTGAVCPNIVLKTDRIRVSLLTPQLLRLETGSFTDLPTQTVWNRDLGKVSFRLEGNTVVTDRASFTLDLSRGTVTQVRFPDGQVVTDLISGLLPGTARTLDTVNGSTKLEMGILSRSGAGIMDDSESLLLCGDDILPRETCRDIYCFAYGHDYLEQLRDFFRLTGPVPLIPKFALGNWWSRYRAYTQEEYRTLMQTFLDRKIPITVATIDMDWHWVDVVKRFGEKARPGKPQTKEETLYNLALPGWTGYSWNTELFPDHRELLSWLHDHGFHVTLNVHPSQGIRFFEDCYQAFCEKLGHDPDTQEAIPFDITDPAFRQGYFDLVHRPMEAEGVNFWWLDWQQGKKTRIPGLDPLWALNHYHTLDQSRSGKRPLILSRYAGLGSHRYPLGFSGDTIVTWKSLDFQPYFTITAANAGYTWWSHDIGGHMRGIQDDELYLRWLQFGVFSPVNRLHSSNSDFMGKEPWKRSWAVCHIAEDFLRLRHALIPYLYSANYRTHTEGIPICMPLYYIGDQKEAYEAKNEYLFGSELLVCPITEPSDRRLNLAKAKIWLPEGRWTDIFTGRSYRGGGWVTMFRDLDSIPVLAKEGAIVPMYRNRETNDLSLDQPLEVHLWRGSNRFTLYEDDGETMEYASGRSCATLFTLTEETDSLTLTVTPPTNNHGLWTGRREFTLCFRDIARATVHLPGEEAFSMAQPFVTLQLENQPVTLRLTGVKPTENPNREALRTDLLTRIQKSNSWKNRHFRSDKALPKFVQEVLSELEALI